MSTRIAAGLIGMLALLPETALAQQMPERHTIFGADYGSEALDGHRGSTRAADSTDPSLCILFPAGCQPSPENTGDDNIPDWTSTTVSAAWFGAQRRSLSGQWRQLHRYDVSDNQFVVGAHAPMSSRLALSLEGSLSPDHRLVPQNSISADLGLALNDAWTAHLGGNQSHFSEADATALHAGLEVHRSAWRLSYSLEHGRLDSGESGNSHSVGYDRYYGQGSQIGLVLSSGAQPTRIDPQTVVVTDVLSATLSGRHWFGRALGISCTYGWVEQGDFYTRQGGSVGLLLRFWPP